MKNTTKQTTVALAVHSKVVEKFNKNMSFDDQVVRVSAQPEYHIMTFNIYDYMDVIPKIQEYIPYVKVIMPIELDDQIKLNLQNYEVQSLT